MKHLRVKVNKHPLRNNNAIVNVMYELYLDGRSLEQIAKMYGKTRQAVYDVFRSRGYPRCIADPSPVNGIIGNWLP
jgi:hypothetical protein